MNFHQCRSSSYLIDLLLIFNTLQIMSTQSEYYVQPSEQFNVHFCILFPNMTCYFQLIHISHESELCGNVTICAEVINDLSLSSVFRRSNMMGKGKQTYCSKRHKDGMASGSVMFVHTFMRSISVIYQEGQTYEFDDTLNEVFLYKENSLKRTLILAKLTIMKSQTQ